MKRFFIAPSADQDITVSSQEIEHHLDDCDAQTCVLYSHSPSVQVYFALKNRLEKSSEAWLQEFVALNGLESLLDSLCHMVGPKFSGFSDAILQIDCLSCIRAVLNSPVGMDALVASRQGLRKLLKGVDLANTLPRKHITEILSVVCLFSQRAYKSLLHAMEEHKREIHMYHRFSFIVNELKLAETVPHKTAVLTLINSIICCTQEQSARCRIRNEFIGLTLLDVLAFLQREDTDEDLSIQLQVFQDKKHEDEVAIDMNSSLDLSSPQDLADAIQTRVFGSSKMASFVNILQDLLAVETRDKQKSDVVWQILESHVHHVVHAAENVDSLSTLEAETFCQVIESASNKVGYHKAHRDSHPSQLSQDGESQTIERKPPSKRVSSSSQTERRDIVTPKTPADSGYIGCEDKLSPPMGMKELKDVSSSQNNSPAQNQLRSVVSTNNTTGRNLNSGLKINTAETAPSGNKRQMSVYDNMSPVKMSAKTKFDNDMYKQLKLNNLNMPLITISDTTKILRDPNLVLKNIPPPAKPFGPRYENRDLNVPAAPFSSHMVYPTSKMKNLKWIKLDDSIVDLFPHSLWANTSFRKLKLQPDLKKVEGMFKETNLSSENHEMALLSNETRVRLNLFLNRLEDEPTELVRRLLKMDGPPLSLPFIKHLVDILPEHAEVKLLKQYNGNLLELGAAEQFVLHLSDLSDYRVLVTGHLRRAEFGVTSPHLRSVLGSMLDVARAILCSDGLRQVLQLVLLLGNFLNHGQFNGYAGGFTMSSLTRLADVKSNESGQNLVHVLVSIIEAGDERLLAFLTEIPRLEKASSSSPSDIKDEFDKLNTRINSFVRQLAGANTIIREGFDGFLEEVKSEFRELQGQITELKCQSQRLSEFFCESDGFELQGCLRSLLSFFKELRRCRHENCMLWKQKDLFIKRSNVFKQQLARKNNAIQFGQKATANSSAVEIKQLLVEEILTELHRGNFKLPLPPLLASSTGTDPGLKLEAETVDENRKVGHTVPELTTTDACNGTEAKFREGTTTPDRDLNPMELSHISVVGTPMMNRPSSDAFDEELTLAALDLQPRQVTSSVTNLEKGQAVSTLEMRAPPILSMHHPLGRLTSKQTKTHHRSRSDLGESMNGSSKWIRYQHQLRTEFQAPLARPESSMTLATLNLESAGSRLPLTQLSRPVALVPGPTVAMPSCVDATEELEPQEFVRGGKRGERKSGTLTNFFTKISKRVLRQKNVSVENSGKGVGTRTRYSYSGSDGSNSQEGLDKQDGPGQGRVGQKYKPAARKMVNMYTGTAKPNYRGEDKENVNNDVNPFDRHKKNPIRLSNRFKSKLTK